MEELQYPKQLEKISLQVEYYKRHENRLQLDELADIFDTIKISADVALKELYKLGEEVKND